jgi:hypothetical protein
LIQGLRRFVQKLRADSISGKGALGMVNLMAEGERIFASGTAILTPCVIETGVYAKEGHGSGPDWLAAVSGSSAGAARSRLAAAETAARQPKLAGALKAGQLSAPELKVLSEVALNAPQSLGELVSLATGQASHKELTDAAQRAKCAARSAEQDRARRARVHAARHLSWHQDQSGGIRGEFLCDEVAWARVCPHLEAETKKRWKAAGKDSGGAKGTLDAESLAAHRLDAFLELLGGQAPWGKDGEGSDGSDGARPHALVLIDAKALRRGRLAPSDTCEIEGVGPVSLHAATELLDEASVQFLIKSGQDINTVTSKTRVLPQRAAMALIARDRTCVVPGCGKRLGLEGDHSDVDYADDGPTSLANMVRLCPAHHAMKTYGGWKIKGRPGNWRWVPPDEPPTAGRIARTRRVTTARATAAKERANGKAKENRNLPRRT